MGLQNFYMACSPNQEIDILDLRAHGISIYHGLVADLPSTFFTLTVNSFYTTEFEDVIYVTVS